MKSTKKYAGVYPEANGTYSVKTVFKTKDGYSKSITKRGFETAKKAFDWKEDNKVFYKNHFLYEIDGSNTPFDNMINQYIQHKSVTVKITSLNNIKRALENHFVEYFKDKDFGKLTASDVSGYYQYIASLEIQNQSKNNLITIVMDFIEFLDLMELVPPEVTRRFKRIITKFEITADPKHDFLEKEEIKALLDTFSGNSLKEKQERLMIYTLIYSGLRKGEMLALTYQDIDMINDKINVNKQVEVIRNDDGKYKSELLNYTKTNHNKVVAVPHFLVEMFYDLRYEINAKPEDIVFCTKKGKYWCQYMPNKILEEHLDMCGLRHIKVHDLRHTFCTMMYDMGFNEQFVASQMGHNNVKTSHDIYEHLTKKRLDENSKLISNLKQ